jgi:hypothetical protein
MLTAEEGAYRFEGEVLMGQLIGGATDLQPLWRARQDSNLRPTDSKSGALSN